WCPTSILKMMCGLVLCPCPIRIWTLTVTNRNQLNAPKHLLGCSRPQFPMDSALAEEQSVSTGAYELGVTWLFLPFPIQVSHLILVDCWGFQPIPVYATSGLTRPGQKLVNRFGPDFNGRFQGLLDKDTIDRLITNGNTPEIPKCEMELILSPSLLPPSLSLSQVVEGAAHQVYVDQPEEFNRVV
uniref:Uncharacterized protein n=1 Tax=Oncorhynchus tshawytscha TaxID=74940 RepID=A0AAZ3Q2C6_ONCTS